MSFPKCVLCDTSRFEVTEATVAVVAWFSTTNQGEARTCRPEACGRFQFLAEDSKCYRKLTVVFEFSTFSRQGERCAPPVPGGYIRRPTRRLDSLVTSSQYSLAKRYQRRIRSCNRKRLKELQLCSSKMFDASI